MIRPMVERRARWGRTKLRASRRAVAGGAVAGFLLLWSGMVAAQPCPKDKPDAPYVRTMTCGEGARKCKWQENESPKPIYWKESCARYYAEDKGPLKKVSVDWNGDGKRERPKLTKGQEDAIVKGFSAWNTEESSFLYQFGGQSNARKAGWRAEGPNLNVVVWKDDNWPLDIPRAIALTSVTFSGKTGIIYDADIELNSGNEYIFTNDQEKPNGKVQTDLQNTIAHEAGHFLGLSHTCDTEATMYGEASVGEIKKRKLGPGDLEGLVAAYKPDAPMTCDKKRPQKFFDVKDPPADAYPPLEEPGCCSTVGGGGGSARDRLGDMSLWVVLVGFGWLRLRRRAS